MKSFSTISGWRGVEPPDIQPLRRQIRYLLRELRWLRWHRWFGRLKKETMRLARQAKHLASLLGVFLLLVYCGPMLRWIDPTAAVIDIGALSLVLLAVVALANFLAVSRWLLGLLWPVLRDYQRSHFSNNFKSLSPWQKITFYLVIFFGLLYAFVVCLVAVF